MLAPLSKAEGEAATGVVSESGGVGVDNTFFGKFGERVEDLVVRLEPLPPRLPPRPARLHPALSPARLPALFTAVFTCTLPLTHSTFTPTPPL